MNELPKAFLEKMKAELGAGFPAFERSLAEPPPVSIRLNPGKPADLFAAEAAVPWHPDGRYLDERPIFTLDPAFHAGAYYVQEASSMLIFQALRQTMDLGEKLRVLDLCAAPGGKSTLLASAVSPGSFLLANEVIKTRVPALKQNLAKWGCANVGVSNHDPEDFSGLSHFFDVVLVDAPCSGEGLFRKDAAAANEWSEGAVLLCAARQQRILESAKELVRPGGILIYSTCTFNFAEDEDNARRFLQNADFEQLRLELPAEWGIAEKEFGYQCYPHRVRGEGFYMAIFRKKGDLPQAKKNNRTAFPDWKRLGKKQVAGFSDWLDRPERFVFFEKPQGEIVAIAEANLECVETVAAVLKRRAFGIEIGQLKKRDFVPSHEFALSEMLHPDLPAIEFERQDALFFLKKENLKNLPAGKGWHLARFAGLNLGWLKLMDGRANNYFPMEWRIRMKLSA